MFQPGMAINMPEMEMLNIAKTPLLFYFFSSYACDTFGEILGNGRSRQITLAPKILEAACFYTSLL